MVETIHCISDDAAPLECNLEPNIKLSKFKADLDLLVSHQNALWVATFGDVARYVMERKAHKIPQKSSDAVSLVFTFTDTLAEYMIPAATHIAHLFKAVAMAAPIPTWFMSSSLPFVKAGTPTPMPASPPTSPAPAFSPIKAPWKVATALPYRNGHFGRTSP